PEPVSVGRSLLGNSVNLYRAERANLLVVGGVHGDESEGIFLAHLLLTAGCPVPLMPCLNPDGALLRQRWNHNNVDLNRNLPTPDWQPTARNPRYPPGPAPGSEPENQALLAALQVVRPSIILSLHSFKESFIEVERPPEQLPAAINAAVAAYTQAVGIARKQSIGYPTPGALGAYGQAQGLLVMTYELLRGASHGDLYALLPPLLALVEQLARTPFSASS
ncbi:MAG TPA: M14 family zinc carboxypeptidase, partial [bacterium]|nr:M14 family zinc carboxypeptidase [bacterium]